MIKYFIYRFPIWILLFTTSAIIFNFISIFSLDYNFYKILLYLFTGLAFLFHLRIVDDYRDFDHDKKYYSDRELQKWKLDIKKLFVVSEIIVFVVLFLNFYYFWIISFFILILWWINSLISINYFWYWKKIEKKYMIFFHILNNFTLNTFFAYLYFNIWIKDFEIFFIFLHFIFVNLLVFLLEITRKVKSKEDIKTNDKYIDKYWYKKNYFIVVSTSVTIFLILTYFYFYLNLDFLSFGYLSYLLIFVIFLFLNKIHLKYKTKKLKNYILIFSLLFYLFSLFIFSF